MQRRFERVNPDSPRDFPQHCPWPRPKWRPGFWKFIPTLLSFVVFFLPAVTESQFPLHLRLLIGLPLFLAPLLVTIGAWVRVVMDTALSRVHDYPPLHRAAQSLAFDFDALKSEISQVVVQRAVDVSLDLTRALVRDNEFYISIARKQGSSLAVGDRVMVIDQNDFMFMGLFKVMQIRHSDYYALAASGVDPLWKGEVREKGETSMFPNLIAIPFKGGTTND